MNVLIARSDLESQGCYAKCILKKLMIMLSRIFFFFFFWYMLRRCDFGERWCNWIDHSIYFSCVGERLFVRLLQ